MSSVEDWRVNVSELALEESVEVALTDVESEDEKIDVPVWRDSRTAPNATTMATNAAAASPTTRFHRR